MPAGETQSSPSAWTIDSVHQHLAEKLDDTKEASLVRFTAQEKAIAAALAALERLLDEIDRRYEQRFVAQEQAVMLALARVDKEFHEHLAQVRAETHAALDASDKAITKAEISTDKRFESVNEFRAQLNDQAQRFMPRLEAEQRMGQNTEKISALEQRHGADMGVINSRLDLSAGRGAGLTNAWGYLVALVGVAGGIIAVVIALSQ